MAFDLYTDVALARDVPEYRLRRGDVVKVVDRHASPEGNGYSIEVFNATRRHDCCHRGAGIRTRTVARGRGFERSSLNGGALKTNRHRSASRIAALRERSLSRLSLPGASVELAAMHPAFLGSISKRGNAWVVCVLTRLFYAALLATATTASAEEAPNAPILRVEAGMHTAPIKALSTDAAGHLALTVSDDKTARLWEMPSGRLLRVLRVPIGEGHFGNLLSGALSPDGSIAAVGGILGRRADSECVYIFDTASGRILRKLASGGAAWTLNFSSSGRFLAAGLGKGEGGLRVWEAATGREMARDQEYGGGINGADWQSDERLITSCKDGKLRLYEFAEVLKGQATSHLDKGVALKPIAAVSLIQGGIPRGVCFSPDGRKIAVGFDDSEMVVVVDGRTLEELYEPSVSGLDDGNLSRFAWSKDGNILAAGSGTRLTRGHRWDFKGKFPVLLWREGGRDRSPRIVPVINREIVGLRALRDGGFLYAAEDSSGGIISEAGERNTVWMPAAADFSGQPFERLFHLSADGTVLATSTAERGAKPRRFSLTERSWELLPSQETAPAGLRVADFSEGSIGRLDDGLFDRPRFQFETDQTDVEAGWRITRVEPDGPAAEAGLGAGARIMSVADQPIPKGGEPDKRRIFDKAVDEARRTSEAVPMSILFPGERSPRSVSITPRVKKFNAGGWQRLAIASDRRSFVLGMPFELCQFDRATWTAQWRWPTPADTCALNISADGALVVAAHADGTIRWHRGDDGRELLAFFPHSNGKHWVLWTPEGYYDCSPGGEELIGWHVDRGGDKAADFVPASSYRDTYYRPDVIDNILVTRDVAEALRLANESRGKKPTSVVNSAELLTEKRPPIVELAVGGPEKRLVLAAGVPGFTLRYRVRGGADPTTRVRIMVNGRPSLIDAPVPKNDEEFASVEVPLSGADVLLSVLAENRSTSSEAAVLRVVRRAEAEKPKVGTKPSLFILAAGVSDYLNNDKIKDLRFAAQDAKDLVAAFKKQGGTLYEKVEARLLTDSRATAGEILDGLDWLKQQTTANDIAIVSLSGHGGNTSDLRYYFCAYDFDGSRELRTSVGFEEIQRTANTVPGKVLFFLDTCHSGNALGKLTGPSGAVADVNRVVNELSSDENGAVVFASSMGRQTSIESESWKNGAFTHAIVEGLDGKADLLGKGQITIASLETYVAARVGELTGGKQTPTVAKPQTIPDFAIALRKVKK